MAPTLLTEPYATVDALRRRHGVTRSDNDDAYLSALLAASANINTRTGRSFALANDASARVFRLRHRGWCDIDDLSTLDGATVEATSSGQSGTWSTLTDVVGQDVNGTGVVEAVLADGGQFTVGRGCWLRVTPAAASEGWGWGRVPADIAEAALLIGARLYKRRDSPEGVIGFEGAGVGRLGRDPDVSELLGPWCRVSKWAP